MMPAVFDQTTIDISVADYTFRATGLVQKFAGYLAVYQAEVVDTADDEKSDEGEGNALPRVTEGQTLRLDKNPSGSALHATSAPLQRRNACQGTGRKRHRAPFDVRLDHFRHRRTRIRTKEQGRFSPTMLGERVSLLLVKSFEDIFDVTFTARLEEELDEIEEGKLPWREAVKEFWEKFIVDLDRADDEMLSYKAGIPTGKKCEKCGEGELLERISRLGFFLGCSRYPDCDFIQGSISGSAGCRSGRNKNRVLP